MARSVVSRRQGNGVVAVQANGEVNLRVRERGRLRPVPLDTDVVIDLTGDAPMLEVAGEPVSLDAGSVGRRRRFVTRAFDLSLAVPAAVVATPLIVVLALVVRLTSRGPAIYSSRRLTRDGEPFSMWKFRTMVTDGDVVLARHFADHPEAELEYELYRKLVDDPRVTRVGRFLRRTNLDELPQLYNVVFGRMSVVGPRPLLPEERDRFGSAIGAVCQVKGGITGLWQVSGRSDLTFDERIVYDVMYVADRTVSGDVRIIGKTVHQMFRGDSGAY